ncbi:F-actin-capping protein subunit alpha [Tulasnella sp. 403]|nr:F-actin-capping protein subunit alpha [Tulasnella sp. 403]
MAVENNVTLIDEVSREFYALVAKAHQVDMKFDQIDRDIAPFLAIPAAAILDRMAEAQSQPNAFQLTLAGDFITIEGSPRKAAEMVKFLADAIPNLPDMTIYVSYSDIVPYVYGDDFRAEVNRVLAQGEYLSPENITRFESQERNSRQTMTKACFDDAPAVLRENGVTERETPNQHFRFIYDHLASMSFCDNPDILDNHSAFLNNGSWDSFLIPLFVQSKIRQGANLLYPSLLRFQDFSKVRVTPWSERTNPKLFWRGRTTGGYHWAQRPWRNSHRIRLHNLANNATLGEDIVNLLTEDSAGRLSREMYRRKELNGAYLDTGLIGPPMQCSEDDGTCDDMRREIKFLKPVWHNFGRNKYMLDVGQFATPISSLGATIDFCDPQTGTGGRRPVQHDYSDLYDVMAFFAGSPEGNSGHEDLAEKIGMRAAEFVRHYWRWEDMQIYVRALMASPSEMTGLTVFPQMYRLLLEYARVINPDREAMSYKV